MADVVTLPTVRIEREMTERDAALQELARLRNSGDPEGAHSDADAVLCSLLVMLGYRDVVDAWMAVPKWYA